MPEAQGDDGKEQEPSAHDGPLLPSETAKAENNFSRSSLPHVHCGLSDPDRIRISDVLPHELHLYSNIGI
jgi:hypothetical protein